MAEIHYRYATVEGRRLFYREAGPPDGPVVVLLHGFPSSSFMFRNLIPRLADRWRLIAPDHLGFGHSDAPPVSEFDYTFDALADLTRGLLGQLGVDRYGMYVQDFGAPIGFRLALRDPAAVTAIISQNGNAYEKGMQPGFFEGMRAYWTDQNAETEAGVRRALSLDVTRWQYLTGVADESLVDPDTWEHDFALLSRPGMDLVQLKMALDYRTNVPLYPVVQAYFREYQVPLLAVWGAGDPVFAPDGARAFADDLPKAEIHLLAGGHFLLESALDDVVPLIRTFLTNHR
ncbi:alpha/beta fold hydrolase [Cryptosporangium phraense]|uniref:Alpha/beta hydrolase n=1 Tax=Cryptosporangium phraense TaxID=2593070 RepID=A0A545ARL2_9ACTN|nr:alpha/beta hydrolase [Cryptosporangium phraense]TQS43315.1 alpha/beta hydrolase [Cryptosporangium phraense]